MTIFVTMAETAEMLGYSHDYFQSNWRHLCCTLQAPFPVNAFRRGRMRWRRAELDDYARGRTFAPPAAMQTHRISASVSIEPEHVDPDDWDLRFAERARRSLNLA